MKNYLVNPLMLAGLAAALAFAPMAMAQDAKQIKMLEERFLAADKNSDGKLTLAEAQKGMPKIAKGFDTIDTDKKGYVTLSEIKAMMASREK